MDRHPKSQRTYLRAFQGNFRDRSFWLEQLPEVPEVEPLRGSYRCDIAIIGGGFTGLSTAYNARVLLPGADVRVLEANVCGSGSSGRNAGCSGTHFGVAKSITASMFGREQAIAAHHYAEDAVNYVDRFAREHDIDCAYEKSGSMLVATTPAQVRRVDQELRIASRWGLEGMEAWDEARLADEFDTQIYRRGMFDRRTALLDPALLARGMMRIAKEAGAIIHELSPALSVSEESAGFCIRTPEGELRADRLVYATNAYSVLFPILAAKQTPIYQQVVLSEPLTGEQLASVGWKSRCALEDARQLIHYYRLTADNRILIGGGDMAPAWGRRLDRDSNQRVFSHLKRHVIRLYPQLRGLRFTHQWGGIVSVAADTIPVIGYLDGRRRALFALGLMGHGVSVAPYNGLCLAELLADQKTKRTEAFFVGRTARSWPPHVIRFPILQCIRGVLKMGDRFRWD